MMDTVQFLVLVQDMFKATRDTHCNLCNGQPSKTHQLSEKTQTGHKQHKRGLKVFLGREARVVRLHGNSPWGEVRG